MMFDPSLITDMIEPAHSSYWFLQPFIAEAYDKTFGAVVFYMEHTQCQYLKSGQLSLSSKLPV